MAIQEGPFMRITVAQDVFPLSRDILLFDNIFTGQRDFEACDAGIHPDDLSFENYSISWATMVEVGLFGGGLGDAQYENGDPVVGVSDIGSRTLPPKQFLASGPETYAFVDFSSETSFAGTPVPGYELYAPYNERYINDVLVRTKAPTLTGEGICVDVQSAGVGEYLAFQIGEYGDLGVSASAKNAFDKIKGRAFWREVSGEIFWYRWEAMTLNDHETIRFVAANILNLT